MTKRITIYDPDMTDTRKAKITKALTEVDMIASGKLPRKSARDFLRESRDQ